jgi:hypothetical protein
MFETAAFSQNAQAVSLFLAKRSASARSGTNHTVLADHMPIARTPNS